MVGEDDEEEVEEEEEKAAKRVPGWAWHRRGIRLPSRNMCAFKGPGCVPVPPVAFLKFFREDT